MIQAMKGGFKTSEFWVVFTAGVITALAQALGLPEVIVSWLNGLAIFYLTSRTVVKAAVAKKIEPGPIVLSSVFLGLVFIIFLSGCSFLRTFSGLSPLDRAIVTADRLSVWYADTHEAVADQYAAVGPDRQAFLLKNVNPKMNSLKGYILGYVDAVNLWRSTGKEPSSLAGGLNKIDVLTRDVLFSLKE